MAEFGILGDAIGKALADYYKQSIDVEGNIIPTARQKYQEVEQKKALFPYERDVKEAEAARARAITPFAGQAVEQELEKGKLDISKAKQELGWAGGRVLQDQFGGVYLAFPNGDIRTMRPATGKPLEEEERMKIADAQALSRKLEGFDPTKPGASLRLSQALLQHPLGASYIHSVGGLARLMRPGGETKWGESTQRAVGQLFGPGVAPDTLTSEQMGRVNALLQEWRPKPTPRSPTTTTEITSKAPIQLDAFTEPARSLMVEAPRIIKEQIIPKLDASDRAALTLYPPEYIASKLSGKLRQYFDGRYMFRGIWDPTTLTYRLLAVYSAPEVLQRMRTTTPSAIGDETKESAEMMYDLMQKFLEQQ